MKTVRRNATRKIKAICDKVDYVKVYSLGNCFSGEVREFDDLYEFVMKELGAWKGTKLYDNENGGSYTLHIHSNLWYELYTK